MGKTYKIRQALMEDLPAIVSIYNAVIKEGGFTADLKTFTLASKKEWFLSLKKKNNIYVISDSEMVAGYFYFSLWRDGRQALKTIAEISFYIAREYRGQGLGNTIMLKAIALAGHKGFTHLLAILLDINHASLGLLKKFSFETAGHLSGIAQLKDRSCGQYIMLKKLS